MSDKDKCHCQIKQSSASYFADISESINVKANKYKASDQCNKIIKSILLLIKEATFNKKHHITSKIIEISQSH